MGDSGRISKGPVSKQLTSTKRPGTLNKSYTDGYRCPKCNKKLAPKMALWKHYELEPNCGED